MYDILFCHLILWKVDVHTFSCGAVLQNLQSYQLHLIQWDSAIDLLKFIINVWWNMSNLCQNLCIWEWLMYIQVCKTRGETYVNFHNTSIHYDLQHYKFSSGIRKSKHHFLEDQYIIIVKHTVHWANALIFWSIFTLVYNPITSQNQFLHPERYDLAVCF